MADTTNPQYQQKKQFFDRMLTVYGRKPVLEVLQDPTVRCYRLHLADSNQSGGIIDDIIREAQQQQVEIVWHDRKALSRISRNGKQDQGVAADLELPAYRPCDELNPAALLEGGSRLLALDGIHNPQNLGMIIRSVAASGIEGMILPRRGSAALSPLVMKASAGTVFKAPIFHCETLVPVLTHLRSAGMPIVGLSSHARQSLFDQPQGAAVYVLGNETEGVSAGVTALCDTLLSIPMHNDVESLNVAVTATLLAFSGHFRTANG